MGWLKKAVERVLKDKVIQGMEAVKSGWRIPMQLDFLIEPITLSIFVGYNEYI
jgi:hypothetical protein